MHDRHLEQADVNPISTLEAYHWYHATSKFSRSLSQARASCNSVEHQASFWTTGSLLGLITFCHIESRTPEEAWPIKNDPMNDLNWLKMSDGKHQLAELTQDLQADRRFRALQEMSTNETVLVPLNYQPLPFDVFTQFAPPEYQPMVEELKVVLQSNCLITIILKFWSFVHTVPATFKYQLGRKDPTALFLLLLWFTKLHELPIWWLKRRTSLEGRAICLYLSRYHADNIDVQKLLPWPRQVLFSSSYR